VTEDTRSRVKDTPAQDLAGPGAMPHKPDHRVSFLALLISGWPGL
jgi:hypothetical protein